jgi:DNA-binding XRE family transcriptional regulator
MKTTTRHEQSEYGVPVILDDSGAVMDYAGGIKEIRARFELSTQDLADRCGVSRRTVEGWEQGKPVNAASLNVMGDMLADARGKVRR